MSIYDIITRVDALCNKYEKYNTLKDTDAPSLGGDAFQRLYSAIQANVDALVQKSNDVAIEKNRASVATTNAEIRHAKASIKLEFPKLEKLSLKKVKGVSKEELEARPGLVSDLLQQLEGVNDGFNSTGARRRSGKQRMSGDRNLDLKGDSAVYPEGMDNDVARARNQHTEQSQAFRDEFELRRITQDQSLDAISAGLATLKSLAQNLSEEMDKQEPLLYDIEVKVDQANTDLKSTNKRMKEMVLQMRSTRNFALDIILLCILLGLGMYLYDITK